MATVTRSRRAAIQREAAQIRMRCQRQQHTLEQTVTAIRTVLSEVSALEAWRFALGWSRADTVAQIAGLYLADGLLPPGLSESMLCRWEHDPDEWPGPEYTVMLCRIYAACPEQLGLHRAVEPPWGYRTIRYGQPEHAAYGPGPREGMQPMTTAAGLPAVRESLHLALLAHPDGSVLAAETAEAAVEHYALNYSKHPPQVLFNEVRDVRQLLAPLTTNGSSELATELQRQVGWLSALLGNLAFHLDDTSGARTHLAAAAAYGERVGDPRLVAWAWGAQSMIARTIGRHEAAVAHAERGIAAAPAGLVRAQLHAWALLPALARQGRGDDADQALTVALSELESDREGSAPGRFGFDEPELALHQAEAHLALGRTEQARHRAQASADACPAGTPGWAAATLVLAQAEATTRPDDAAQRAIDILERIPPQRLRSTTRARLTRLDQLLPDRTIHSVADLNERLRVLPTPIDAHGQALSN
ncbi:Twin-arginine translocation pathway signal [Streptomyces sp. NPDC002730]|uniref:Twin-arginine translocation pathway signal n=1 Tax=Streptomyces sp. NPDC002730 TaxID=3364662 RepID=UPI0036B90CC0